MVEKIVVCSSCKGSGKVEMSEEIDYHHRIDDVWDEPCYVCGGTGRMVEQVNLRKLRKDEIELRKRLSAES